MSFEVPENRRYLDTHEWIETNDSPAKVGITDFAQDELGDVVFVELPAVGDSFDAGEQFGTVESIKAVSDLFVPVSGTVTAVNEALESSPELVNDDPYDEGWMIGLEVGDSSELDGTLTAEAYRAQTE